MAVGVLPNTMKIRDNWLEFVAVQMSGALNPLVTSQRHLLKVPGPGAGHQL